MQGHAKFSIWFQMEIRPGYYDTITIDPVGVLPTAVIENFSNKCLMRPWPIDTYCSYTVSGWFWEDISHIDSLEVKIVFEGTFWKSVPEDDSCRVIEYGPFEWSSWVKVAVEK